jgi:putative transposase
MDSSPRKQKVTYNMPGHAHFLTYSCYRRLPLLSGDRSRAWVVEVLQRVRHKLDFDLWAYIVMPEHVHLLIHPRQQAYRVENILAALKRPVSAQAKAYLESTHNTAWLEKLTVQEGSESVFRFWQAGGGYDKNLWSELPLLEIIDYIHANPVRRGLVEQPTDWMWSSARFWAGEASVPLRMDPLVEALHG